MGHTVFISHTSADRATADMFCRKLEADGIGCWIAPRDVLPGQRYAEAIVDAIDECDVFMLVFSAEAAISPHVANEIEKAASKNRPILLVKTDATHPHDHREISLFLGSHQWFDASETTAEQCLPRLVAAVEQLIAHESRLVTARASVVAEKPLPPHAPETERAIGIDIGSSNIRGWVEMLDQEADVFDSSPYLEPIARPATARTLLEQVTSMISRIVADHFEEQPPMGIGIAAPGLVDARAGTLKFSPGLGLRNIPLKTTLGKNFPGVKIRVDNDTRCATRCELHVGVGHEFDDFACIFVGTGVGSGIVIGGHVHFGQDYAAGEIGHIKIDSSGAPCACGQIGCLETFVNGPAIAARARAKAIDWESRGVETLLTADEGLTPEMVVAAIEDGDLAACEVADELADKLAIGIASYLNLLNPGAVVLGGGVMSGFYLHIIDRLSRSVQANSLAEVANTPIIQSQFTDHGAAIGAALMFHPSDAWPY